MTNRRLDERQIVTHHSETLGSVSGGDPGQKYYMTVHTNIPQGFMLISDLIALEDVVLERSVQDRIFGQQDHVDFRWLAILSEEVGEAA